MREESTLEAESRIGLKFIHRMGHSATEPLMVFVHGRAGDRGVMWPFERCVPESWHIVSFQAFLPDPIGGWSWWQMTPEGSRREAIELATDRLAAAVTRYQEVCGLAPRFVVGAGFSQGAVLVSHAALSGAVRFSAFAGLAGFVLFPKSPIARGDLRSVFIAHGRSDDTISVDRAREGVRKLQELSLPVEFVEEDVGHKVGIQGTRAMKGWLQGLEDAYNPKI